METDTHDGNHIISKLAVIFANGYRRLQGERDVMNDFDFVQEKPNHFFSDGVHRIAVIPKEDSGGNTEVSDVGDMKFAS